MQNYPACNDKDILSDNNHDNQVIQLSHDD